MAEKTVGQLRESQRYMGSPETQSGARIRRSLDRSMTPDSLYMKDAVNDTVRILQHSGFERTNQMAKGMKGDKSKGLGKGQGFVNTPINSPKKGFKK